MNRNDLDLKKQRERLSKVFEYLKKNGISQKEIADKADIDPEKLSQYKNGKIKYIPNTFLEEISKIYNINPRYVRLQSDYMVDIPGMKLSNFEAFIDAWDVVDKTTVDPDGKRIVEKYLHFTMDKNFYEFLIDVDKARQVVKEGLSDLSGEIEQLKEIFSGEPEPQEFVLIPRNVFINILTDLVQPSKTLEEAFDLIEHLSYIEE